MDYKLRNGMEVEMDQEKINEIIDGDDVYEQIKLTRLSLNENLEGDRGTYELAEKLEDEHDVIIGFGYAIDMVQVFVERIETCYLKDYINTPGLIFNDYDFYSLPQIDDETVEDFLESLRAEAIDELERRYS